MQQTPMEDITVIRSILITIIYFAYNFNKVAILQTLLVNVDTKSIVPWWTIINIAICSH